jgi:hypothetical protein
MTARVELDAGPEAELDCLEKTQPIWAKASRRCEAAGQHCGGLSASVAGATMMGVNVRRLAAIDMYGTTGTIRRRRIILAEFTAGAVGLVAVGAWLAAASAGLGGRVLGIWMIGAGLNYAPLAAHAVRLSRPGALEAELAGVDTGQELRRYSIWQLWILVPLFLAVLALHGALRQGA